MKLKEFFIATLTAPVLIACGAEEKKDTFKLNGAGATFNLLLFTTLGSKDMLKKLAIK